MKGYFSILLLFAVFLQTNCWAQKTMMAYETGKEPKAKILISGGKPVFIIALSPEMSHDNIVVNREKKELENNFKYLQPDVTIEYTNIVIFKNKSIKKFDFTKSNESGKRIFYWDGKVSSDPVLYNGLVNATEFFAQELNVDVVSNYNIEFEKLATDYLMPPVENITKKSKEISDLYLNKMIMSDLFYLEKGSQNLYKMNFTGVKSITSVPDKIAYGIIPRKITFDEDGLPINISYIKEKKATDVNLSYENGLFRHHQSDWNLYYIDDKIIEIEGNSRRVYSVKDDVYLVMRQDTFYEDSKTISWREIDIQNNTISYKENGGLNNGTYELTSRKNIFPVIHRVAHSQEDNLIEKKGLAVIETYQTDNTILIWTFTEKGLIEKFLVNSLDENKRIEITYLYEYYK